MTGHDEGVGLKLRTMALAVRNEEASALVLLRVPPGDMSPWQAWLYGYVSGVVKQARDLAPDAAEEVRERWKFQRRRLDQDGKS